MAHAGDGIEFCVAPQSGIDDDANAFDGETGLRDGGGQHDFTIARRGRRESRILSGAG